MLYLTQLIYIKDEEEDVFQQFERLAIPLIAKYNGSLLMRIRPSQNDFIEGELANPYEVHLVKFPTDADFENFCQDAERKQFLHLKEQAIQSVLLIKGSLL